MKRRLALVLTLTLAVTACVGCGKTGNTKDTAVTNNEEQKDNSNKEEEVVEGMQESGHEEAHEEGETEYDEHVWLSLKNAAMLTEYI